MEPALAVARPRRPLSVVISRLPVLGRRPRVGRGRFAVHRRGAVMRLHVAGAQRSHQLVHLGGRAVHLGAGLPACGGGPVSPLGIHSRLIRPLPRRGEVNVLRAILTGAHFLCPQSSTIGPGPRLFRPLVPMYPKLLNQRTGLVELNVYGSRGR